MAINQEYYGAQDTWSTAHAKSKNQDFEVKIASFNPSNTTECYSGALPYKWGSQYDETESYNVENDTSFCYIAMDKNAPQLHSLYSTITITSGSNTGHFYGKLTLSPENNVPFGWAMGTVRDYITVIGTGEYWHRAPINYEPIWYDEDWHPTVNVYSGQTLVSYLSESAGDLYAPSPILSFPYRNIKLVPVIRAYALASGKTENDVKNAQTLSDFTSVVNRSSYCIVDLKTYLEDTYDGTPFYERYPVIASIYAVPVLLFFDENGNLAIPTGDTSYEKYHSTAESTASWGTLNSAFYPMYFNEKTTFDEIFYYDGSAYPSQDDRKCETLFFNPSKAPFSFVDYGYNGGTNPTKSLSVDTNGWGAFCVAGRAAGSANNRTDIYCRVIDNENWRTFWNTANGDCDCGNLISDYQNLNGFREYVRKIMAYFGMFFSDGVENDVEETSSMDTQGLFLGIVDESGITHGTYSEGTENRNQINYDWEDPVDDTPWTPGGDGGDLESDDEDYNPATRPDWNGELEAAGYNKYLIASDVVLNEFTTNLVRPGLWTSFLNMMFDPIECIIAFHLMPRKLAPDLAGGPGQQIVASVVKLTETPTPTFTSVYKRYDLGTVDLKGYTKDFMDYNLTSIYINLPYVGMKEIDIEACIDGQIGVFYEAEALSGDCTATVWVKDRFGHSHYRYEYKGNCARRLPLNSYISPTAQMTAAVGSGALIAGATYAAAAIPDAMEAISSAGGLGGMSGGWGFWASEFANSNFGQSALKTSLHRGLSTLTSGLSGIKGGATTGNNASGGSVSSPVNTECYLIIPRPKQSKPTNYIELDGLPSDKAGQIKDFTGYFAAKSIKFDGIACTTGERNEIQELLMAGIYI